MTLVMVSGGYPGTFEKGFEITVDESLTGSMLYHSGTSLAGDDLVTNSGKLVTNGGRVLALTVLGNSIDNCRSKLYAESQKWSHCYFEWRQFSSRHR